MKITKLFLVLALAFSCATVQAWDDPVSLTGAALYSVNGLIDGDVNGSVTSYQHYYDAGTYGTEGWLFNTNALPHAATYDFGSAIELSNLVLWNWSADWDASATNRGVQDFTLTFSDDNVTYSEPTGYSYTALEAISSNAEPSQVFEFVPVTARYVRITVISNYGHADWAGIGEARFNDPHIPVEATPSDGATGVARDVDLSWTPYDAGKVIDYDVYFGTDPNVTTVLLTDSTDTTVDPTPGGGELLDFGTTYYWRVDTNYQILPLPNEPNMISQLFSFETVAASPVVADITPLVLVLDSGATAQFTVTGTNIEFYEWYEESDPINPLTDAGDISGATTATLSIANVDAADEGKYYCVVSNSTTIDTDQSDSATLMLKKLVAHWTFDGTLADSAGPWDGTWSGTTPTYVSGADGVPTDGAIVFDGTDYVDVAGSETDLQFQETGITIAVWIYNAAVGDTGDYMRVISKRTDYELVAFDDGFTRSVFWDGATERLDTTTGANDGVWRLIVQAYDADTGEMVVANVAKVDGFNLGSLNSSRQTLTIGTNATTPDALRIGAVSNSVVYGGNLYPLDGFYLDDVRLYNYALSDIDIAQLYTDMTGQNVCVDLNAEMLAGDINDDCEVNLDDFAAMAATWLNNNFLN